MQWISERIRRIGHRWGAYNVLDKNAVPRYLESNWMSALPTLVYYSSLSISLYLSMQHLELFDDDYSFQRLMEIWNVVVEL